MLVKDWMTENVVTLEENETLEKAFKLLEDFKTFRKVPITKEGKLAGIITLTDIKGLLPYKAKELIKDPKFEEFFDQLKKIPIKEVMTKDPIYTYPDETIEKASVIMLENKVSGLPVVDKAHRVVGIITETDIFRFYTLVSGVYFAPYLMGALIGCVDDIKSIRDVLNNKLGAKISSILMWDALFLLSHDTNLKDVMVRFQLSKPLADVEKSVIEAFNEYETIKVLFVRKDTIEDVPSRRWK
ncbi:CBS domain-containing protein [Thermodesulfobacterium sp. TA1]|uniref:CBS domain-containing protein n=1 Tax=Thermodesulfobacterium sp. TA1 TaxID=2234087 RepID=UPI001232D3A1|nr:CBS domain-containing protein [Thermodesulfobacterium sp. TA1]QER42846.1 CBS domain-containing protein [Thermodesulfobacterium sp. TA1]